MKSGSGKSSNYVGQSVLGSSKSITCSKVAALQSNIYFSINLC